MKVKMYGRLLIAAVVSFTAVSETPLGAEALFLKDGAIIFGTIETDTAASVTILTDDKKQKRILRKDIMRILYKKLKMGKIFIQKRDGKGVVAFIVDEDQESYTFRKELYSPEEFTLKVSEVLFMAEKNPSGLQVVGTAETDRVDLTWLPPYGEVKKYNIYIKKNDKDKYELHDSTSGKTITLKNLSSNTKYFLIATSVDGENYESAPSNEITITTKNIPPDKPEITSYGDIKADERKIIWSASNDPDGKVEKYKIYGTKDDKRVMIAETKKPEYVLKKALEYKRVEITAVDNNGAESDSSDVKLLKNKVIGFYPGVLIPMGKFGDMYDIGFGGMLALSKRNMFFQNFEAGISAGFYYAEGKNLLKEGKSNYDTFMMAPLLINAGYRFEFRDNYSVVPSFSFGFTYINMKYINLNTVTYAPQENIDNIIDPTVKFGLNFGYSITESISVSLTGEYGMFIEESGPIPFVIAGLGIDYRF